jgi:hypothetical protein
MMPRTYLRLLGIALSGTALALLAGPSAFAARCHEDPRGGGLGQHCGLDSQTDPPNPALGGTGGCTDASIATQPLYKKTHQCAPGETMVIYDLAQPFPDNQLPGDHAVAGSRSYFTLRASAGSPCEHMIDTVDPKPCPDPIRCPDPMAPQPEGARKVTVTGYAVGCWSPPRSDGCRSVRFYNGGAFCMHAQHELLGPGCTSAPGLDCPNTSTEQIVIDEPGNADRVVCVPKDPTTSCRATRTSGEETFKVLFGGFCATANCANPGVAPVAIPKPGPTCLAGWGQTAFGFNVPPGRGIDQPGWYDWKTGAFKMDITTRTATCGALGLCLGRAIHATDFWDLSVVAVPRAGQAPPCVGNAACDPAGCFR